MEIFSAQRFEMVPLEDGKFDAMLRLRERNGWGDGKLAALLSFFRGLPYQTVYPEVYNLGHSAINFTSLVRWDAQKRRAFAALSGPLGLAPQLRWRLYADTRNENWAIAPAQVTLGGFNFEKQPWAPRSSKQLTDAGAGELALSFRIDDSAVLVLQIRNPRDCLHGGLSCGTRSTSITPC